MKYQISCLIAFLCISSMLSQTTFAPIQNIDFNIGDEPYEIASGDLDGDGDKDVVMATYNYNGGTPLQDYIKWYKNDGMGNFTAETTVSSSILWVDGLDVANVDGQFGFDIIATSVNDGKLVYFPSDGSGGFGSEVIIDGILPGAGQVVTGDINQDGNVDIVTVSYDANRTVWYSGDGSGNFTAEVDVENGTTNGPYYIDIGDFDGDTDLDIVVGFANTQSIEIFYNQYIESGTMTVSWIKDTVTVDSGNSFLLQVAIADVNNDDVMDIVKLDNVSGDVEWFNKIKNGASTPNIISNNTIINRPGKFLIVDIDGDTQNDVILTDGGTANDAIIWFKGANNASPSTTPTTIDDNNYQMFDIAAEDFDDDTDIDIATIGNFSNTIDWYENELITLNLNSYNTESISMYPNPANDVVHFKGIKEEIDIEIYNMLGNQVLKTTLNNNTTTVNIKDLASGVYIINFGDFSQTKRLTKQ